MTLANLRLIRDVAQLRSVSKAAQASEISQSAVSQTLTDLERDLGLMSYAESSREIVALPWRQEEMVVAVAPRHQLALHESVRPVDLQGQPFIGFDDDLPIQGHIDRYLRDHKVEVEVVLHFDNLQMIKEAVAHGSGLSILPKRVMLDDLRAGRIMALQLEPAELFRPLQIIHRRRRLFNGVTGGLLALLKEEERSNAA